MNVTTLNVTTFNETTLNRTESAAPILKEHERAIELLYVVLVYTLLEDKGFRFNNPCVGVLLRANLVLTTLSCLEVSFHGAIDTELMVVYVRDSQVLKTERVFIYPDMKDGPNVALILCETSRVEDFPRLPEKEFKISDFEYCTLCGFGSDAKTIKLEHFNSTRINRSEMEVCDRLEEKDWVCLHFANVIPCRGDVGAPLVCDGALQAIFNPPVAPWAPPSCLDSYGATFTRLHPVVHWIRRVNKTLELPLIAVLNKPYCWVGLGVTALTVIVVIYYALMKFVDWRCDRDEGNGAEESPGGPRVIYVRSSQMSRVTNRWLWPG